MERVAAESIGSAASHVADQVSQAAGIQTSKDYMSSEPPYMPLLREISENVRKQVTAKSGKPTQDIPAVIESSGAYWQHIVQPCERFFVFFPDSGENTGLVVTARTPMGDHKIVFKPGWTKVALPLPAELRSRVAPQLDVSEPTDFGSFMIRYSDEAPT